MSLDNISKNKSIAKIMEDLKIEIFENFNLTEIKSPNIFDIKDIEMYKIEREITFDSISETNVFVLKNEEIFRDWMKNFLGKNNLLEENGYFFRNTFFKRDEKITNLTFIEKNKYTVLIKKINFNRKDNLNQFLEQIYSIIQQINKFNNNILLPKKIFISKNEINSEDILNDFGRKYGLFFNKYNNFYKLYWFNFENQINISLIDIEISNINDNNYVEINFNLDSIIQLLLNLKNIKEIWNI